MTDDRKQLIADIAVAITTLAESPSDIHPASTFYIAFGMDMERFQRVRNITQQAGYIEWTQETAKITDEGREMAAKINEALENAPGKSTSGS